jgi:hypothetical protein
MTINPDLPRPVNQPGADTGTVLTEMEGQAPFELPNQGTEVAGIGGTIIKRILKEAEVPGPGVPKEKELVTTPEKPTEPKEILEAEPEAERIGELEFEAFDVDDTHHINFDMIETTDDIKSVIADVGERQKYKIDEARRGKITNQELMRLSSELNINQDIVRQVMERESGGILNAETILGARQVLNGSSKRIVDLAKKVRAGDADDREKLSFLRQVQFHREYQAQFMGARAEAGRALNAFSIPVGADDVSIARMKELTDVVHGGNIDKMADMFAEADSVEQVGTMAKLSVREKIAGSAYEVFVNSILSGIKTHVVNTSGNALFQGMNIAETAVAAQIGRFMSGEEHVMVGEAKAHLYGMMSSYRDAMRVGWKGLKTGEGADVSKLETRHKKFISSETLEITGPAGRAVDLLGSVIRFPTERLLTSEDEFFKTFAKRGALTQLAYREAARRQASENLTDAQTAQVLKDFLENPPEGALAQMDEHALYSTFQNPLGEKGRAAQKFVASIPGVRYLAPFMRTPINLFKDGLMERSPLAAFSRKFHEEIRAGGARRDMALARVSMGSLTVLSVAVGVDSGAITGGGPSDASARKALQATGWKPYSIRIEDPITGKVTYQSYQRGEPLSYVIGATADAVEIAKYTDYDDEMIEEDERITRLMASVVAGVANNTMSKTFLSGLADFNQAVSDPGRYAKGWAQRMAGAFIPYSAFRRDMSKIQDPIMRDAWDFKEKLRATGGLPGWSEDSPPRLDIYGEQIYHPRGDVLGVLTPYPDAPETTDPIKLEVAQLMLESKKVPIRMMSKRVEGMKLTNQEYHTLTSMARSELKLSGKTFKQALQKTMNSKLYRMATVDTQVMLLKEVQQGFDNAAKAKLYLDDAEYRDRLNRFRAKKAKQRVGESLPERLKMMAE